MCLFSVARHRYIIIMPCLGNYTGVVLFLLSVNLLLPTVSVKMLDSSLD